MRYLEAALTQPHWQALGWALLHFLWQGAGVAVLLAASLALLRGRGGAGVRYAASCAALALMLLLPALTAWSIGVSARGSEVDEMLVPPGAAAGSRQVAGREAPAGGREAAAFGGASLGARRQPLAARLEGSLPWLTLIWVGGVLALTARMLGGLLCARRLARRGTRRVAEHWEARLKEVGRRMRVTRPVRLLESSLVLVPTAVGWLRPVILLPASALVGLTPRQLEVILAHELAHVRRHDYLVNLLQTVAETLLFYHPAVWWVSRRIRVEREHVCDDLAVAACGDALAYARALTKLERLRGGRTRLAVAADGGSLRGRVLRLVGSAQPSRRPAPALVILVFVASLFATVGCARAVLSQRRVEAPRAMAGKPNPAEDAGQAARAATDKGAGAKVEGQSLSPETASLIAADETAGEDAEVRRAAIAALGSHAGSVVVLDPRTGRVYAVVNQEWALRRGWTPASTMKLVTVLAGVGEKLFDPSEKVRVPAKAERLDLTDALAVSDNDYFKALGERVGAERIITYARRLGLGEPTGINYEGESAGRLPVPRAGASAARLGAFGEGVEVTPVQLAALVSAIANGGTLVSPYVPRPPRGDAPPEAQARRQVNVPREVFRQLVPGLLAAVERGTASGARGAAAKLAGKTGSITARESSVGLFASYAPADDPRLVVVVLTRGRDESGPVAATIAGTIYRSLGSRL